VNFRLLALVALATSACSHTQLSGADLDRVQRPAYVGRVAEGAGPKGEVNSTDATSQAQLVGALNGSVGRFEMSERLRSQVANALHTEKPWSSAVPAAQVASALETFLVERVPAVPPNYSLLKPTGADAVVELVIEDYGVRQEGATVQTYLRGSARMFLLADGSDLWRTSFERVAGAQGLAALDPSALAKDATPYGEQMRVLLDGTAQALALELTPPGRRGGRPTPAGSTELSAPADAATKTESEVQKSRAPAPDLTPPTETPTPNDRTAPPKKPKSQTTPDLIPPTELPVSPKQP
jgi:hypothetical protein